MIADISSFAVTREGNHIKLEDQSVNSLAVRMRGELLTPANESYEEARKVWNGMIDRRPALIARCYDTVDVAHAIDFAREHDLLTAIRGGGHNAAGNATCDGGIMIDLSPMRAVSVDPERRTARAQGGATWAELDAATQVYGLATPGGAVSTTGIAGLTLSGGIGHLRRKHGLTIDNLLAVKIVTADGQVRTASAEENPDLFWALRGGGGNFGVVTEFEYRLHPVGPEVYFVMVMYPAAEAAQVVPAWRDYVATAPDELSCNGFFSAVPPAPMFPEAIHGREVFVVTGAYTGDLAAGEAVVAPLRNLATPLLDVSAPLPYSAVQSIVDPLFPHGQLQHYWKSISISNLSAEAIETARKFVAARPSPLSIIDFWAMGGAAARVPADATAFGDRSAAFWLVFNTTWVDPADAEANIAWTREFWQAMRPYSNGAVYLNFPGLGEEGEQMVRSSLGANYERLVQIKAKYDPDNFFRLNQNIKPQVS